MKNILRLFILTLVTAAPAGAQHDHSAHAGHAPATGLAQEPPPTEQMSAAEKRGVRAAVKEFIAEQSEDGVFILHDEKLDKDWRLRLLRLEDRSIRKHSATLYSAYADFKSTSGRGSVGVDFRVNRTDSGYEVREALIQRSARRPKVQTPLQAASLYVCPMNDFRSDKPGRCPKCGMELQKQ